MMRLRLTWEEWSEGLGTTTAKRSTHPRLALNALLVEELLIALYTAISTSTTSAFSAVLSLSLIVAATTSTAFTIMETILKTQRTAEIASKMLRSAP
jgi:hypothetical protein